MLPWVGFHIYHVSLPPPLFNQFACLPPPQQWFTIYLTTSERWPSPCPFKGYVIQKEHECRLKQTCPLDSDIDWNEGAFLVSSVNITGPSMPVIYSFVFSWSAATCCAIDPTLSLSRTLSIGPIWLSLVTRQHEHWPDLPDPSVLQPVWVVSHPACQPAPWCNRPF
jgi:hypothetical protein